MQGPALSTALRMADMLLQAFSRTDELFDLIPRDALMQRPISLRHPLLFYLGHLPAFAWNQVGRGALGEGPLHPEFDQLFERGIDPADEASACALSLSTWPAVDQIVAYREKARRAVLDRIPQILSREHDILCARGRVLHLVCEHELMHQETLMYLLQECPAGVIQRPPHLAAPKGGPGCKPEARYLPAGWTTLGAQFADVDFGWDNEFGTDQRDVAGFFLDSLPARNCDWLDFLRAVGPSQAEALMPASWLRLGAGYQVKTVFGPVPMELAAGWPVQVSGQQARVYCAFYGGRLPTEAELHRAAFTDRDDGKRSYPWGSTPPRPEHGNFGFSSYYPVPTGSHPAGQSAWGIQELCGNGWEWTQTSFAPLPGFTAWARSYPGYSSDFFDDEHDVVFGASWATDQKLLRPSFRNWYRPTYPFAFTSFRVARDV